jgi:hypothetical protein
MCENNLTTRSRVTTDTEEARAGAIRAKTTLQHGLVSRQTLKKRAQELQCENNLTTRSRVTTDTEEARAGATKQPYNTVSCHDRH